MWDTFFCVSETLRNQSINRIVILPIAQDAAGGYNNNAGTVSCGGTSLGLRDSV